MSVELDRLILEKYDQLQEAKAQLEVITNKRSQHRIAIQNLPWGIRQTTKFVDNFLGATGSEQTKCYLRSIHSLNFELPQLIKSRPGTYQLSHLTYNPYPVRELGFPHFTYGFTHEVRDSSYTVLFAGNSIMAMRSQDEMPAIQIQGESPPVLHLPDNFALLITKRVRSYNPTVTFAIEQEGEYYAVWKPVLTETPRAIRVSEDEVIPWRPRRKEVETFTDTEEVTNFKYK